MENLGDQQGPTTRSRAAALVAASGATTTSTVTSTTTTTAGRTNISTPPGFPGHELGAVGGGRSVPALGSKSRLDLGGTPPPLWEDFQKIHDDFRRTTGRLRSPVLQQQVRAQVSQDLRLPHPGEQPPIRPPVDHPPAYQAASLDSQQSLIALLMAREEAREAAREKE